MNNQHNMIQQAMAGIISVPLLSLTTIITVLTLFWEYIFFTGVVCLDYCQKGLIESQRLHGYCPKSCGYFDQQVSLVEYFLAYFPGQLSDDVGTPCNNFDSMMIQLSLFLSQVAVCLWPLHLLLVISVCGLWIYLLREHLYYLCAVMFWLLCVVLYYIVVAFAKMWMLIVENSRNQRTQERPWWERRPQEGPQERPQERLNHRLDNQAAPVKREPDAWEEKMKSLQELQQTERERNRGVNLQFQASKSRSAPVYSSDAQLLQTQETQQQPYLQLFKDEEGEEDEDQQADYQEAKPRGRGKGRGKTQTVTQHQYRPGYLRQRGQSAQQ